MEATPRAPHPPASASSRPRPRPTRCSLIAIALALSITAYAIGRPIYHRLTIDDHPSLRAFLYYPVLILGVALAVPVLAFVLFPPPPPSPSSTPPPSTSTSPAPSPIPHDSTPRASPADARLTVVPVPPQLAPWLAQFPALGDAQRRYGGVVVGPNVVDTAVLRSVVGVYREAREADGDDGEVSVVAGAFVRAVWPDYGCSGGG